MIARLIVVSLLLWFSGCATQPETVPPSESWPVMQHRLQQVDHWSFSGKLGVQQAQRADSAIISSWEQNGGTYRINLTSSILGLGQVEIQGNPAFLIYRESGEEDLYTTDPEGLILAQTGWTLPLDNLRYWVRGLAAPNQPAEQTHDEHGYPVALQQAGWSIVIGDYSAADNDADLLTPHRLTLQNGTVKIKIVIKQWNRLDQALSTP